MPENANPESVDTEQAVAAPPVVTNPRLTANLQADYDAIRNDLEQAQHLAADFQRQAADKSNEVAHIKRLLEKTTTDLANLEAHVNELRQERHRLANELMVAAATELELMKVKKERDRIRSEFDSFQQASMARITDLQGEIVQQRAEIAGLEVAVSTALNRSPAGISEGAMQRINDLTNTVARLSAMVENKQGRPTPAAASSTRAKAAADDDDFIDISFGQ